MQICSEPKLQISSCKVEGYAFGLSTHVVDELGIKLTSCQIQKERKENFLIGNECALSDESEMASVLVSWSWHTWRPWRFNLDLPAV
jgi:hypothetical protein